MESVNYPLSSYPVPYWNSTDTTITSDGVKLNFAPYFLTQYLSCTDKGQNTCAVELSFELVGTTNADIQLLATAWLTNNDRVRIYCTLSSSNILIQVHTVIDGVGVYINTTSHGSGVLGDVSYTVRILLDRSDDTCTVQYKETLLPTWITLVDKFYISVLSGRITDLIPSLSFTSDGSNAYVTRLYMEADTILSLVTTIPYPLVGKIGPTTLVGPVSALNNWGHPYWNQDHELNCVFNYAMCVNRAPGSVVQDVNHSSFWACTMTGGTINGQVGGGITPLCDPISGNFGVVVRFRYYYAIMGTVDLSMTLVIDGVLVEIGSFGTDGSPLQWGVRIGGCNSTVQNLGSHFPVTPDVWPEFIFYISLIGTSFVVRAKYSAYEIEEIFRDDNFVVAPDVCVTNVRGMLLWASGYTPSYHMSLCFLYITTKDYPEIEAIAGNVVCYIDDNEVVFFGSKQPPPVVNPGFFIHKTELVGNTENSVDGIDPTNIEGTGQLLTTGCTVIVITNANDIYLYRATNSPGAVESVPDIIIPDINPGNWYWQLVDAPLFKPAKQFNYTSLSDITPSVFDPDYSSASCIMGTKLDSNLVLCPAKIKIDYDGTTIQAVGGAITTPVQVLAIPYNPIKYI